jgi:hypothetical protein
LRKPTLLLIRKSDNYATCAIDSLIDYKIDVLRFAWKTSKTIVFKKRKLNGKTVNVSRKDENFIAPDRKM